ncbi:Exodeoxyribonuclease 8 [Serratia proteamaculans]|uniref:RecE family exodeoxyribonuclease n=1 Tax=Serratia proteamaculans TaxID=28151 RepID=UPI00217873E3|nr:RecE family exodeoxyribonuclease [Serratia proteamaculans]CAI1628286.1 Exodeoxyribonuclease 8 [Serratia proteamaculans]
MQNVYAFYLKAKQKTGKPSLFIWFDAKNDSRAQRDLANYIEDAELEEKDYFKAARTDYPVNDDLPPEGAFSETWCDRYELADDKRTWQLITTAGKQEQEQEQEQEQHKPAGEYFATNLDKHTVIAAAWLYGRNCLKLNEDQLKTAKALVMDDAQRYPQNVILALTSLKQFEFLYPEMPVAAIAGMKAVWPPFGKAPELGKLCQFTTEYLDAKVEQRADVITKWLTSTGGAKPSEQVEESPSWSGTAIPAIGDATLKTQVALSIKGTHPSDAKARDVKDANGIVDARDPAWRAWYSTYCVIEGIQEVDTDTRHAIISEGLKNLSLISNNDERLHFVKSRLVDHPACPGLMGYKQPDAGGAQQNDLAIKTTSNEGEKTEVAVVSAMGIVVPEPERRAWIRNEVMEALSGKTRIMSESDVTELMQNVSDGSASLTYVARVVAIDIEPHDPFCQLSADDVHHITCDVLENWNDEPDPRAAFLNERVEFNLKEAAGQQQENPELVQPKASNDEGKTGSEQRPGELRSIGNGQFDVSALFTSSPLANIIVDEPASTDLRENEDLTTKNVREYLDSSTKAVDLSGETAQLSDSELTQHNQMPSAPPYFEPGRYHDIPNEVYHSANGISSTMAKDARISLMYYHGRHVIKTIGRDRSDALTFGSLVHTLALEPEKMERDFNVEPIIPEGALSNTASMRAFIDAHNETLPKMTDSDTLRSILDEHNAKLPTPYALGGNADEIGRIYALLPPEFQSIPDGQKFTSTAMKACIKEYNATLPEPLKTSGPREALLEQLALIDLEFATLEKAIPSPLPVSGSKEDMATRIRTILPTAIFADELIDAWRNAGDGRQLVTQQQIQHAKAIQRALFTHPSAGPLLQHEYRAVEASYFGFDEETGLEVRVRPDLEIDLNGVRVGVDLKSISMGRVKQDALRAKLHREIIDRDYHLSAAMYSDVAAFDQFFWIFVNKDEGYHWVAIVEASPDLLELGRLEYKKAMRDIKHAYDTETWPAPITKEIVDDLNDFDQRRIEALRVV